MSKTYQATTSDGQQFDLEHKDLSQLDAIQDAEGYFHVLIEGEAHRAKLIHGDKNAKQYTIEVNGNPYTISLADEYDVLVKQMGLKVGGEQKVSDIKAPMPGLVLEVSVAPGAAVEKGDALLILEAMKMENVLKAHGDGVVKSVHIQQGDAVEKSQLLIEME